MIRRTATLLMLAALLALPVLAQSTGTIEGRLTRADGSGLPGVIVLAEGTSGATVTESDGRYSFRVAPGSYTLIMNAGEYTEVVTGVDVRAGATTTIDRELDWDIAFAETITVYSASRRPERIVEAPAAVTVVPREEIELLAPTGQLPKVLESAPGVDYSQSGLYDINFNARGFNSSLNRRILTLVDGRDPAVPFLGAQEWAALSYPIELFNNIELVRGPGSALYGANAYNGVLNMITSRPGDEQGGKLRLTGGDLDTLRADIHHAGTIADGAYYRVVAGYQQSDDYTRSRNMSVEYANCGRVNPAPAGCLPYEAVPLALDEGEIGYGGFRFDKDWTDSLLTLEIGTAQLEGPTFQTGIGRVQTTDVSRPWARANFSTDWLNVLAYYDQRVAEDQVALASGGLLWEDSSNLHGEIQTNFGIYEDRGRFVLGASYTEEEVDTSNDQGVHTLMAEAKDEDMQAVFGQLDFDLTDSLKLVLAARWDDSSLHEAQTSPKGSLVYSLTPNHTLRATYNEAFQVPNYSEFFLRAPAAAPIDLSLLEAGISQALGGIPLGLNFASVPVLALGNDDLDVETIETFEIGYAGIFGTSTFITVDYYQSEQDNFVTDLLPGVNPDFPAYAPPSNLPPQVQAIVLAQLRANLPASIFAGFTNLGPQPAVVFSYTNAGRVDTEGVEVAINYYINNNWVVDANYSYFDFEILEAAPDLLLPNAPENKFNLGLAYRGDRWDASIKYRWVDDFIWATGVFNGPVPSYDVISLNANYNVSDMITIGTAISNLADDEHWESFGGDILNRRALGYVSVAW